MCPCGEFPITHTFGFLIYQRSAPAIETVTKGAPLKQHVLKLLEDEEFNSVSFCANENFKKCRMLS